MRLFYFLVTIVVSSNELSIPYIPDIYLQPLGDSNANIRTEWNQTCHQCLCEAFNSLVLSDYLALNCLNNNTCQYFRNFPLSYKLKSSLGAKFYLLKNIFPNESQCCMPNITELLNRLKATTPKFIYLPVGPGAFGYDEKEPFEAGVISLDPGYIYWFNPINMTLIRNVSTDDQLSLGLYENLTFTALNGHPSINVRNSQTNALVTTINYTSLGNVRKFLFINNGQTIITPTQNNLSLTFINVHSPTNYSFDKEISCPLTNPHGIAKVNDSLIYVSSWTDRSIASYIYNNVTWTYQLFVNHSLTGDGSHLAVDECQRVWFVTTTFGLRIYDSSGIEIGSWNITLNPNGFIYDVLLLLPNYVVLISDYPNKAIIQYDPQLTCS